MTNRTLTATAVERIRVPATGQADHFDQGYPGLALRVSYGGVKGWVYFYRLFGKQKRLTLGRWPSMSLSAARDAWRNARTTIDKGENPQHQRPARSQQLRSGGRRMAQARPSPPPLLRRHPTADRPLCQAGLGRSADRHHRPARHQRPDR